MCETQMRVETIKKWTSGSQNSQTGAQSDDRQLSYRMVSENPKLKVRNVKSVRLVKKISSIDMLQRELLCPQKDKLADVQVPM